MGALMGTLIGDALGVGCHWYYDVAALQSDYGPWVDGYRDSRPERTDRFGYIARHRHEYGLRAGDLSQTGEIATLALQSVAESGGYDARDFCVRLDTLFASLDGTELSGRYSDHAVRETWARRRAGHVWGKAGSRADTAEAAIWSVVHAARPGIDMRTRAIDAFGWASLTHASDYITGCSAAFVLSVAALIEGAELATIRDTTRRLRDDDEIAARTSSNDVMFQIGNASSVMGGDATLGVEPVVACRLFGMHCTMTFQTPSAYFLLHRYPDDFERAILTAVNAGGNNMARAALTGAVLGAHVGLQGIPHRLVTGLADHERLLALCDRITG